MPENWDFFQTNVEGSPASIFADFGLGPEIPVADKSWVLVARMRLKHPSAHGLSTQEEADDLWALEDALVPAIIERLDAMFVGRITSAGRRDFYFYAPSAEGLDLAVSTSVAGLFYEYETFEQHDPEWSYYRELLYPSDWDWQSIHNRRVLESLKREGDPLEQPRRLHHFLSFKTGQGRDQFCKSVSTAGFGVRVLESDSQGKFGLHVHRIDAVNYPHIDDVVFELFSLAEKHNGEYDGWETQVVKAGETPVEDAPL